jgi:cytochrome c biogenesis protein CcmG/thiol:disulfide interchange protein DsbE
MNKMLTAILVMLIVLSFTATACQSEAPEIGKPAPDFQLNTLDGQTVTLSELRGIPVLVNFWTTWCDPCRSEMPYLQQVYEEWQEKGLVLLAINIGESPSQVAMFMQSQGLSLPVLLDSEENIAVMYNVRAIPTTFFIDEDGIIQHITTGAFRSKEAIESILSQLMVQ